MVAHSMLDTVSKVQKILGYKFNKPKILWEALQAPGAIFRSGEISGAGGIRHSVGYQRLPDGNKRLAIVGDTVLKLALVEDWYKGHENRERLSRMVSDVGSNENLVKIGLENGFEACINVNPSQWGPVPPLTMAGTVEAVIGAVYLDSGMKSVGPVMQNLGLMPRLIRKTIEKSAKKAVKSTSSSSASKDMGTPFESQAVAEKP